MKTFRATQRDLDNLAIVLHLETVRNNGILLSQSDAIRAALAAYVANADTRAVEQARKEIKKSSRRVPEASS